MRKVEYLFPKLTNIFGDFYNMEYLGRCHQDIDIIRTDHKAVPYFADHDVDMVYLGSSTEIKQKMIIDALLPYRDRLQSLIDKGTVFLATGNALEIFGKEICDGDTTIPALDLFDFVSRRHMDRERHNSQYIGTFTTEDHETITMLGHKSQFSFAYGDFDHFDHWIDIDLGIGMNPETLKEGIRKNHFFATYSVGPCFIMNPLFCKYILRLMQLDDHIPFGQQSMEAYEYRRNELIKTKGGLNL